MVKLKELRSAAAKALETSQSDSPLADVDFILSAMGFSKTDIIIGDKIVDEETKEQFLQAVERVKTGEPVQYVVGGCEFMSMWFEVSSATLIPRCDTEILVEKVIERCKDETALNIFEIGSGSGCIAISLAKGFVRYEPDKDLKFADVFKRADDAMYENKRKMKANNMQL